MGAHTPGYRHNRKRKPLHTPGSVRMGLPAGGYLVWISIPALEWKRAGQSSLAVAPFLIRRAHHLVDGR